jgi:hypothetical protein
MKSEQPLDGEQWQMDGEQWQMDGEQWQMDGEWKKWISDGA